MLQNEKVGDFYDRINTLLDGARNSLREVDPDHVEHMMYPLLNRAIDIFIRGLPVDIARVVDAAKPADLDAAYREAVRLEVRIDSTILPDTRYELGPLQCNDGPLMHVFPIGDLGNNILEIAECSGRVPPIEITQRGQFFVIRARVDTTRNIDSSLLHNILSKVKGLVTERGLSSFKITSSILAGAFSEPDLMKIIKKIFDNSGIKVSLE